MGNVKGSYIGLLYTLIGGILLGFAFGTGDILFALSGSFLLYVGFILTII